MKHVCQFICQSSLVVSVKLVLSLSCDTFRLLYNLKWILQSVRDSQHLRTYIYNILAVHNNCVQRKRNAPYWIQGTAIFAIMRQLCKPLTSHVRTSYVCPMVFAVSSMSRIAYVTITVVSEDSTNPCLFQQCASDINDLAYVTGA